jgi:hypothetical protein
MSREVGREGFEPQPVCEWLPRFEAFTNSTPGENVLLRINLTNDRYSKP